MPELHTLIRAQVQFPQYISALDYLVPEEMSVSVGDFVLAELGRQTRVGVVLAFPKQNTPPDSEITYKPILKVLQHIPSLSLQHLEYLHWLSDYYLASLGQTCRLAFSGAADFYTPALASKTYRASGAEPKKLGVKQQALYEKIVQAQGKLSRKELLQNSSSSILRRLLELGYISETDWQPPAPIRSLAALNTEQEHALSALSESKAVCLLDGATGSGKTEVYFHRMAELFDQGKQVLVLLPEVSLLIDWQQRFHARFGFAPHLWHNGITQTMRRKVWQQAADGQAKVIVGARSALHLPMHNLGLIIVDEEHDSSYKQEDGIPYHARDMAVVRGRIYHVPVLLASATPSFETLRNAESGKYHHVVLSRRHKAAALPDIELIDLNIQRLKAGQWLSSPLREAIRDTLEQKQQSVLFLNRRGFAPLLLCRGCGHRFTCPNCDVYLSEHLSPAPCLVCHHCDYRIPKPSQCPECDKGQYLSSHGPGVERIIANLAQSFPSARTFAATAETLNSPENIADFLHRMHERTIDIVVGTQIIAKGLDFPHLTLAGVVDADQALFGSNPRSGEMTWQLLHQIAGRTGRHHLPGRALLQTRTPEDVLFQSLKNMDRDSFTRQQSRLRESAHIPPFGRMIALIVQSRNARRAETVARRLAQHCPDGKHRLLGPAPAAIARLRGWYRWRLLLISPRHTPLQPVATQMLKNADVSHQVRIKVDVDPYNFV